MGRFVNVRVIYSYIGTEENVTASDLKASSLPVVDAQISSSKEVRKEKEEDGEIEEEEDSVASTLSSIAPLMSNSDLANRKLVPLKIDQELDWTDPPGSDSDLANNGTSSPSGWRRAMSYEMLEDFDVAAAKERPKAKTLPLNKRSNSSDHLSRPPFSSPTGKRSLTLSTSGSEAESIYGMWRSAM